MDDKKIEKASALFEEGFNCAQAVVAAYATEYGFTREQCLKMSASFGGGIGRMRETCGAACGLFLLAGLETGATEGRDTTSKMNNYATVKKLAERFIEENGALTAPFFVWQKVSEGETNKNKRVKANNHEGKNFY